jgi:hypothetical protein
MTLPQEMIAPQDIKNALETPLLIASGQEEEVLIQDERAALSPVEQVDQKLVRALQASSMPVSRLQYHSRPRPS